MILVTTPGRREGEWRYSSTRPIPMHHMGVEDQFHAPATVEGRNMHRMNKNLHGVDLHDTTGEKMNIRLLKHGFRLTVTLTTENGQCPSWASRQDRVRLRSDCLTRWKITAVVRIISNAFCIHCCKYWTSQSRVNSRFRISPEIKIPVI